MRFRPCIDIHNGKVKQIVGSTLRDSAEPVTNYESDMPPSYFAQLYRRDGFYGGHVIMLGPGNEAAALDAVKAFPGGLQAGGGINPQNAALFLDAGATHVIVTSFIINENGLQEDRLTEMKKCVGINRLVIDLSCKKVSDGTYMVLASRWQKETGIVLSRPLFEKLSKHCDEFLIHAVHVEGLCSGIDKELVRFLRHCTVKPITYAGGVRSLDDIQLVADLGEGLIDITAGSALDLFGGKLEYKKIVERFGGKNIRDEKSIIS